MLADIKSRQIAEKNGHSECPIACHGALSVPRLAVCVR
jgi:hypothetical protein